MRVLVVDGPRLQQYAARELMESWGVQVELCSTVGEMLDRMQERLNNGEPYHAVLLDEQMAGSDSRAVITAVLTTSAFQQAKLVVLTSVARNRDVERMAAEGLAVTVTKPVRFRPLLESLTGIAASLPARRLPAVVETKTKAAQRRPSRKLTISNETAGPEVAPVSVPEEVQDPVLAPAPTPNEAHEPGIVPEPMADGAQEPDTVPALIPEAAPEPFRDIASADLPVFEAASPVEVIEPGVAPADLDADPGDAEAKQQPAESPVESPTAPSVEQKIVSSPAEPSMPEAMPQETAAEPIGFPTAEDLARRAAAADVGAAILPTPDPEDSHDRTYALVIEDDLVNQRVAKMMLENMGCIVDVASSGEEAVALFETRVYDLVLVDCRMSGMDGYQTTAALRKMEAGERHTPIVAVSADTSDGVRERCLAAGMDTYIAKPVHAEDLQYEIERLLDPSGPVREAPVQAPIEDILDRRALMARVAGNTDVLRSLANLCQAECARLMSEIQAAIGSGDRSEFLRATHKLRGNIMSMEARAAVEAVRKLELTANQGRPADAEQMLEPLRNELDRLLQAMNAILDEADAAAETQ